MSTKTSGPSRSWATAARINSTSAQPPLRSLRMRFWSRVEDHLLRKMHESTWLSEMRLQTRVPWMRVETPMLLLCAVVMYTSLEASVESKGWTRWRNMKSRQINGPKWQSWKINATTWALARSMMNLSTPSVASSEAQSKKSMIPLRSTMWTRTLGSC